MATVASVYAVLLAGAPAMAQDVAQAEEKGPDSATGDAQTSNTHAAGESVLLPSVTVSGEDLLKALTEDSDSYASDNVTLGKGAQSVKDIPQSVSVITRQRMDDQNMTTLADAMESATGITVEKWGPFSFDFSARGYQIDKTLLDGSPIQSDYGSVGTSSFDTALFDRVEVLRGPTGLLHGAGEPSGTINLVRKRARGEFGTNARVSAGSWDTYRGVVDVTGALDDEGRLRGRFVGVYEDRESFVDHVYGKKKVGYGTLEYDVTPDTTLSAGLAYQRTDSRPHFGLPKYADGRIPDVDRSTNLGSLWNSNDERIERYFVELEHGLANGGEFNLSANYLNRYTDRKRTESHTFVDPETDTVKARRLDWYYDLTDKYVDASLSSPFSLFGNTHKVLLGASYYLHEVDSEYLLGDPLFIEKDVFDPINDDPEPPFGQPGIIVSEAEQRSVYAKTELGIRDDLTAVAGARVDWWEFTDVDTPSNSYDADGEITPYAGVIYDITPSLTTYVSYTSIYQPQPAERAEGGVVEPRTGDQLEAGIKGAHIGRKLRWQASVFRINDENRAVTDPDNPEFSVGVGEARSQGFEFEVSGSLLPRWEIAAGYAYTDTEYVRDPANEGLVLSPRTPKHDVNLWTRYRFSDDRDHGWRIGAGINAVSGVYVENEDVRWEQGGYTLLSAMVGYRFNENLDLSLHGDNLTDKKYFARIGTLNRHTYYGEPRNVTLTLDYRY